MNAQLGLLALALALCYLSSAVQGLVQHREKFTTAEGLEFLQKNLKRSGWKETKTGLQYRVVSRGPLGDKGLTPNATSPVLVHYFGQNIKGEEFDSSRRRGRPTEFRPSDVIAGWREALMMMHEGDTWEIVVPAELAYQNRKMGTRIDAGAVLFFNMELIKVTTSEEAFNPLGLISSLRDMPMQMWVLAAYGIVALLSSLFRDKLWGSAKKHKVVLIEDVKEKPGNVRCYMDIRIGDETDDYKTGRIEVELFNSVCPKTCENFRALCTGEKGLCAPKRWALGMGSKAKPPPLCYKGTKFHRIISRFMAQGGDIDPNSGGESIYGPYFDDEFENGAVPHSEPYLLSMANCGPNTNSSQFFITFAAQPHLDQKHCVFGRVVKGQATVDLMEKQAPKRDTLGLNLASSGVSAKTVQIVGCGQLGPEGKELPVLEPPAASTEGKKEQ